MDKIIYDAAIIGGGAAGLSCAVMLASGLSHNPGLQDKRIVVIDNGRSDMNKAAFFNAPGVRAGISGPELLAELKEQALSLGRTDFVENTAIRIKDKEGLFKIKLQDGEKVRALKVVVATGYKVWNMEVKGAETGQATRTAKSGRTVISHKDNLIRDNLYVAGTLSDISSQFAIAAGSGGKVAIDILSEWKGGWTAVHDKWGGGA